MYKLTPQQLLLDLHQAFHDACKHKGRKQYVLFFKEHLEENLVALRDELWNRTYRPCPSSCFVVTYPKRREVFAAEFRDRIVHHLYYNYTMEMFSRMFIQDSYSCLPGRGTHYGISRLERHIRSESRGYSRPCYVLKMDISGYFMHIDRQRLLSICLSSLQRMASHRILRRVPRTWGDVLDMDFLRYLSREIILLNPVDNCRIVGRIEDWNGLPCNRSLFHLPPGLGLPIGNLTSQLFSNLYLNELDQWMKRDMHCVHYGRYVDDFYVVSSDKGFLLSLVAKVSSFLTSRLGLQLQQGKTMLFSVRQGVPFLGAYLKMGRRYVENRTIRHMKAKLFQLRRRLTASGKVSVQLEYSINSYLGVLGHCRTFLLRRRLMAGERGFSRWGLFSPDYLKFRMFTTEAWVVQ